MNLRAVRYLLYKYRRSGGTMKRISLIGLVTALSLGLAAAAFAQTDGEKFAAKQPGLAPKTGHYCTNSDDHHPALFALAQQYD